MRFGHPETQEIFGSLSGGAQAIVKAAVYAQKRGERGILVSCVQDTIPHIEDPYEALNEVLSKVKAGILELTETSRGHVLRVVNPEKSKDQLREEEAERIQSDLERVAAK